MSRNVTIALVFTTIAIWIGWDLYAAFNTEPGDTISELGLQASLLQHSLPWAFGVLGGHIFWPRDSGWGPTGKWAGFGTVVSIFILTLVVPSVGVFLFPHPAWAMVIGIVAGHLLWSQSPKKKTDEQHQ